MAKLRLFIADDHKIVRDGLRALVDANIPEAEIIGEAENGRQAVQAVRRLKPDIVLMDVTMPDLNGVEAVWQLVSLMPECKVIALSMHRSHEVITQMLGAGAKGYLHKDAAFAELKSAINAVAVGDVYLGEGLSNEIVRGYQRLTPEIRQDTASELTRREREVLQLIAEGHRSREIAEMLCVSIKTVEAHRGQINRKLKVEGIAELTKYAIRTGITSLDT